MISVINFVYSFNTVEWLSGLRSMPCTGSMGWRQTCATMATIVEEALEVCGDKNRLLLLTTPLLEWVCLRDLPVEARLPVSGQMWWLNVLLLTIAECIGNTLSMYYAQTQVCLE